ncbi:hypothetical protein BEWA_047610 [Theileria equi strain WA]|uniref:Uncharacterized protein n=1 Tax=Theileria equi strain WA TaxID=1537102 RepID=L1LAG4_THEEQ|nr:hypothetical protein BEWA_047610 [Theileria equi strain WA]EKX72296.1 hypothetical protein BEWA_047610 [Theileria equi strain WA]|eukprot:XP_004831748.1 hypothetical protein BEWA_047610 [Theileria equi strain WA]
MFRESSRLWFVEVLKDICKDRDRGMLRLLLRLSDPYHLKCISLLVLHCRGDNDDPFIRFLLSVYRISTGQDGRSRPAGGLGHSSAAPCAFRAAEEDDRDIPAYKVFGRTFLAALAPLVLHTYITRFKGDVRKLHPCHNMLAILEDFQGKCAGGASLGVSLSASMEEDDSLRCRGAPFKGLLWKTLTPIQRRISSRDSIESILDFVTPEDIQANLELVKSVVRDESYRENPVDNTSGLAQVLLGISSLSIQANRTVDLSNIPTSIAQFYHQIPPENKPIRSVVKSALIYIHRLRNRDLEHKVSRKKIAREIKRNVQSPKKEREETKVLENEKVENWYPCDIGISDLFLKCMLAFEEYFPVFNKVCDADSHANVKVYGLAEKSLSLAAKLLRKVSRHHSLGCSGPIRTSAPKFVYDCFIDLVYSTFGMKLMPISPRNITLNGMHAASIVADHICKNHTYERIKEFRNIDISDLLTVNTFIDAMNTYDKRIFITEDLALVVLKVHAIVFKIIFTNLNTLAEMDKKIVEALNERRRYDHGKICKKLKIWYEKGECLKPIYARYVPEYFIYAKTHETFRVCRERFSLELFPKANYLIISHMDRLEHKPVPISTHPLY